MNSMGVVIQLYVGHDSTACFLEVEMPYIRHLNFQRSPEALDGLVVARRPRTRHALEESVLFHHLFRPYRSVLSSPVAVVYSSFRYFRISPDCHHKGVLYKLLCLTLIYRPAYHSPCCHIYYAAQIQLAPFAFQHCYIRTP